ncbi:MAG: hypothetical protein WCC54_31870, partial [Pseudolabrys sp.]
CLQSAGRKTTAWNDLRLNGADRRKVLSALPRRASDAEDAASVDALIRANRCESWPHFLKKIRAYSFTAPVIAET